jgi:hypothetical protein
VKDEELLNRLKQIQEKYTSEIYEFLGPKSEEYKTFYEKGSEVARTMRPKFTATPEGEKIKREFMKKRRAETDEFFKNLGINVNDIRLIRKKYSEEFRLLIEKVRKLNEKKIHSAGVVVNSNSNPEGRCP